MPGGSRGRPSGVGLTLSFFGFRLSFAPYPSELRHLGPVFGSQEPSASAAFSQQELGLRRRTVALDCCGDACRSADDLPLRSPLEPLPSSGTDALSFFR